MSKSRHRYHPTESAAAVLPGPFPPLRRVAVVYYIQWADRIKIGTSRDLPGRLSVLTYDRLLAIEPGSHAVEHIRHLEFATDRITGEWFKATPRLLEHIEALREKHGDPRPAYVKWISDTPTEKGA